MEKEQSQKPAKCNYELFSIITQILAAFSASLVMFNVAAAFALVTVVNGKLTNKENPDPIFIISQEQSSWYGSLQILALIVGSIFAGYLVEYSGRKRCMILASFPHILSYLLLYFSSQPLHLYISSSLSGFGIALAEVPAATFVSETATHKLRGRLFVSSKFGYAFGSLFLYLLNTYLDWRQLALVMLVCPISSACYLLILPETPSWLLSKGRYQDALNSLCWFRGWVSPNPTVNEEFLKLQRYIERTPEAKEAVPDETGAGSAKEPKWSSVRILFSSQFLRPYKIVTLLFFLCFTISLRTVKPYLIIILNRYKLSISSNIILAISSISQIFGAVLMVLTVYRFGKRKLILWTYCMSSVCTFIFGLYALLHHRYHIYQPWIIYSVILIIYFLVGYTVGGMPWYICAEIFPQKLRGIGGGVSIMTANLIMFTLMKSYFTLERLITTSNIFFSFSVAGVIGSLYVYTSLPETENKTLEEIEQVLHKKRSKKTPSNTEQSA